MFKRKNKNINPVEFKDREYFIATRTSQTSGLDYEIYNKSSSIYATDAFCQAWNHLHEIKTCDDSISIYKGDNLTAIVFGFDDGRVDWQYKPIKSLFGVVAPNDIAAYEAVRFINEINAAKERLSTPHPTVFDLAAMFPVLWSDPQSWRRHHIESTTGEDDLQTINGYSLPSTTPVLDDENTSWIDRKLGDCQVYLAHSEDEPISQDSEEKI